MIIPVNVIPNEFYTQALIEQRGKYWTKKYGQKLDHWISKLEDDRDVFKLKLEQYQLRYLFRKDEFEGWIRGKYGDFLMGPIPPQSRREQVEHIKQDSINFYKNYSLKKYVFIKTLG